MTRAIATTRRIAQRILGAASRGPSAHGGGATHGQRGTETTYVEYTKGVSVPRSGEPSAKGVSVPLDALDPAEALRAIAESLLALADRIGARERLATRGVDLRTLLTRQHPPAEQFSDASTPTGVERVLRQQLATPVTVTPRAGAPVATHVSAADRADRSANRGTCPRRREEMTR
jgi:hypothetical protein